jgi:hypothetical protein
MRQQQFLCVMTKQLASAGSKHTRVVCKQARVTGTSGPQALDMAARTKPVVVTVYVDTLYAPTARRMPKCITIL